MSRYSPRARLTNTTSTAAVANWFGNQFVALPPGSFESIATQTVGAGGAASVTFSSIPQTYKHLQIRGISRLTANSAYPIVRPNNDSSTANYTLHQMYGNGSSVQWYTSATGTFAGAYVFYGSGSNEPANCFGAGVINILDYTDTNKYKTLTGLSGQESNTSTSYVFYSSSLWLSTSAITSITLAAASGNLAQYTTFALYGIKGA